MPNRPKKQSEIILIGEGPLIDSVHAILSKTKSKVLLLRKPDEAYFLSRGVIVYSGERIAAKRFMIMTPHEKKIAHIRGIEQTTYTQLDEHATYQPEGRIVVYGNGDLAVQSALEFISKKHDVTMLFGPNTVLDTYDISVQDVIMQHLKKLKVKLLPNHIPIASITKHPTTHLLIKYKNESIKLDCESLFIEPQEAVLGDVGLANHNQVRMQPDQSSVLIKNLLLVQNNSSLLDLHDAHALARILQGKRSTLPKSTYARLSGVDGVEYFSFGVLEQDVADTHVGYKKSISKIAIKSSDITGFIKVIVSLRGKIVGISGIVERGYSGTSNLRMAVKHHIKLQTLVDSIDINDQYVDAYLSLGDNLKK